MCSDCSENSKALEIRIYPECLSVRLNAPGVSLYSFLLSVITAEICVVMSRFRIDVFSDQRATLDFSSNASILQYSLKVKEVHKTTTSL